MWLVDLRRLGHTRVRSTHGNPTHELRDDLVGQLPVGRHFIGLVANGPHQQALVGFPRDDRRSRVATFSRRRPNRVAGRLAAWWPAPSGNRSTVRPTRAGCASRRNWLARESERPRQPGCEPVRRRERAKQRSTRPANDYLESTQRLPSECELFEECKWGLASLGNRDEISCSLWRNTNLH